ncbi:MAG: UDP-N-acetylglucosamine 4,6-dehydratase (inverting) [Candidatus Omnitrophica bacterium]|nr:UDP-N-acetylglucosamine 4,6-dehydratase (inverting) [Candidatus Omnitrophota bacterium]MDD5671007.1 UDP-N-acetylglucosamine 4,6-dehydratase (inverting) [Candidatus Omnitrophota bacterium]
MTNKDIFKGKTILITGGTGSFGKKFTEIVLKNYQPARLIIFSRDEFKQFEMAQIFPDSQYPAIRYFVGDVRDKERLDRAFHNVDYVIHAAALKQVPAAEYNPFEAVKTNILGAQNVINVAIDQGVKKVLALSTDKAANPINLYGATKLCSDKLFIAGNSYASADPCAFSVVRYGNVVGSRGSVIPLFISQRQKGVLTVTDPRMTRFWITLEDAVHFVIMCLEQMVGGELFIPKIPSMNIMDLAKTIAPRCKTQTVGIRPGEKLHEVLLPMNESRNTIEFDRYYVVQPMFDFWGARAAKNTGFKPVPADFEYSSDKNPEFLSVDQMRQLLRDHGFMPAGSAKAKSGKSSKKKLARV